MFENKYFTKHIVQEIKDTLNIPNSLIDELIMLMTYDKSGLEKTIIEHSASMEMNKVINESIDYLLQSKSIEEIKDYLDGNTKVLKFAERVAIKKLSSLRDKSILNYIKSRGNLHILRKNTWYILNNMYNDNNIKHKKIDKDVYKELLSYLIENYSYEDTLNSKGFNQNLKST